MERKHFTSKLYYLFVLTLFFNLFISCGKEKIMGYSIVLWNNKDLHLRDCDIVPVYIKSNISQMYVIGIPDDKSESEAKNSGIKKVEVPLWQLTEPVSKKKIQSIAPKYNEFMHQFASVKVDGLPCRADAVNTSKQVYRFRKGENIKILYKVNGQQPMSGSNPLPGEWFRVLTDNGTQGYCFSYSLNLFETDENGDQIGGEVIKEEIQEDKSYLSILDKNWYPDSFKTMIDQKNIDLSKLNPSYLFKIDTENNKVTLNLSDIHENWTYTGYQKVDDYEYELKNIPIKVFYKKASYIVLRYTGSSGKPQDLDFVYFEENLGDIIQAEKQRRLDELKLFFDIGPRFSSTNYGTITFDEEGTFRWTNYKLLVPTIISANAKPNGMVSVKYAISKSLAANYDGVITFVFNGMNTEVNFLYKFENGGLRLEDATDAPMKGNLITGKSSSPLIMYFKIN